MAQAAPLVAYTDVAGQVEALKRDGYVYFPGVLSAAEIADLRAAMDRLEAREESFDRDGSENGYHEKHIKCVFNRDIHFLQFVDRRQVIEVAEAALTHSVGRRPIECHIIGMTAWVTGPGRPDQDLHVDWLPFPLPEDVAADPRVQMPVMIATAHYYLNDVNEELGPTKFIPGSHRAGRPPDGATHWNGQGEQSLLYKAGDVVLFRSEVWHRGTANNSDETRYLLQVHYANRMVSQKFPPYLNRFQFDPDILARATPRQRRMLGDHAKAAYDSTSGGARIHPSTAAVREPCTGPPLEVNVGLDRRERLCVRAKR